MSRRPERKTNLNGEQISRYLPAIAFYNFEPVIKYPTSGRDIGVKYTRRDGWCRPGATSRAAKRSSLLSIRAPEHRILQNRTNYISIIPLLCKWRPLTALLNCAVGGSHVCRSTRTPPDSGRSGILRNRGEALPELNWNRTKRTGVN